MARTKQPLPDTNTLERDNRQEGAPVQKIDRERQQRFEGLFVSYIEDMTAYASWRARSAADVQDAVAEVFLTAWRRLDDVPAGDAARVWLYATARRVIANQRRSSRRWDALHLRLAEEALPAEPAVAASEAALVREVLRSLGPRDREVLLLAEWEGLSATEIAKVVGCRPVTARGRLHRARQRFRLAFEDLPCPVGGDEVTPGPFVTTTRAVRSAEVLP
jgi:RNA polymerase sigma-70 factor (ECF subfamily)